MRESLSVVTLKHGGITSSGYTQTWGNGFQCLLLNIGESLSVATLKHGGITYSGYSHKWGNHFQWQFSNMGESLPVATVLLFPKTSMNLPKYFENCTEKLMSIGKIKMNLVKNFYVV